MNEFSSIYYCYSKSQGFTACVACTSPKSYSLNTIYPYVNPFVGVKNTNVTSGHPSVTSVCTGVTSGHPSVTLLHAVVNPAYTDVTSAHPSVTPKCPTVTSVYTSVTSGYPSVTSAYTGVTSGYPSVTSGHPSVTVVFLPKMLRNSWELLRKKGVFKSETSFYFALTKRCFGYKNTARVLHAMHQHQYNESSKTSYRNILTHIYLSH